MRKLRVVAVAAGAAVFVFAASLATSVAAFAQATPDAGGAQSFDSPPWSDGFVKALIIVIPVVVLVFMWWAVAKAYKKEA